MRHIKAFHSDVVAGFTDKCDQNVSATCWLFTSKWNESTLSSRVVVVVVLTFASLYCTTQLC